MPAYLEKIIAAHRAMAAGDDRRLEDVLPQVETVGPVRPFRAAITEGAARNGMAVIAEIKRRSPSKGDLDATLDPVSVAKEYEAGGAACLSVLTDADFFAGSVDDLQSARSASGLPVLRKDFTVSLLDVCDARLMGADAVLLIVAALSDSELTELVALAQHCSLTALVEVHDAPEVARALDSGAEVIGVNQRDLRTFEVDHQRALRLGEAMPSGVTAVAESGIESPDDVQRLADAGYQAVLVGERLVRSGDRRAAVEALLGVGP